VAGREDAGLLEGDGRANASVFADDAEAAFGWAIVVRAAIEQHAASAFGAILFWEHEVLFFRFWREKARDVRGICGIDTIEDAPLNLKGTGILAN
jgi:hypothetical protein